MKKFFYQEKIVKSRRLMLHLSGMSSRFNNNNHLILRVAGVKTNVICLKS